MHDFTFANLVILHQNIFVVNRRQILKNPSLHATYQNTFKFSFWISKKKKKKEKKKQRN